jgi:hypothetical protein
MGEHGGEENGIVSTHHSRNACPSLSRKSPTSLLIIWDTDKGVEKPERVGLFGKACIWMYRAALAEIPCPKYSS